MLRKWSTLPDTILYCLIDNKEELKEGDLVFFKIGSRSITHMGVYMGNNKFAHASSSKGVMISDLDEAYWRKYYYKGGRMLASFRESMN
jgi:lipoprotein Spr